MNEFVYGRHAVYHLITAGRRKALRLHLQKGLETADAKLVEEARRRKIPVNIEDSSFFLKKLGVSATHQGVLVETEGYPYVLFETLINESLLLILDEIQDPQNLGALCRSAYLFGVGGVVIPETRSASIGPGVCHASVGTVEYLRVAKVSSIASSLELLKKNQFWIYGADMGGDRSLGEEKFPEKVALVIGNEEKGLKRLVRERCDILLKIPVKGKEVDSLNASVAGGILLYAIYMQSSGKK
jgi:23S rRNA (guanosine2251-2'-O)-methyltransferase